MFIWLRHAFSYRCYKEYKSKLFSSNKDINLNQTLQEQKENQENLNKKLQDQEVKQAERFTSLFKDIENIKKTIEDKYTETEKKMIDAFGSTSAKIKELEDHTNDQIKSTKKDLQSDFLKNQADLRDRISKSKVDMLDKIQNSKTETMQRIQNSQTLLQTDLEKNKRIIDKIEKIFYGSKSYGTSGELYLETIIAEVLGTQNKNYLVWNKQFQINKDKVDFVIWHPFLNNKYIPIDSKFPLTILKDDCKRSEKIIRVKKMINDISSKYVINNENCVGFAFLFIPSESIFNELLANYSELFTYGNSKKVYITSPTNILATISLFIEGTRDVYLTKNLTKVNKNIKMLASDYDRINKRWIDHKKYFEKISTSIENIDTSFDKIHKKSLLVTKQIEKIETPKQDEIINPKLNESSSNSKK